jgi:hypothetical protein
LGLVSSWEVCKYCISSLFVKELLLNASATTAAALCAAAAGRWMYQRAQCAVRRLWSAPYARGINPPNVRVEGLFGMS